MVIHHTVEGYEQFSSFVKSLDKKDDVYYFLFTGSKVDGVSWCPDCVEADPVIECVLESAPTNTNFVTVLVGDRTTWKDPNCSFRKDPKTKLMVIPTLMKWKGPQRLEGEQCASKDLVEMVFTDFDDN